MVHEGGLDRFLPWRKVQDITGLGRTTAWRLRRAGDFPHPVPISPGRVAWRERDIAAWNESRGLVVTPPAAPKPPTKALKTRPPECPVLPFAAAPAPPVASIPLEPPSPPVRHVRRARNRVAEGQLGFDF
jgi:predicted DNA-binding transcriptional regulator AlpA